MVKNSTDDIKKLAAFPAGGPHVSTPTLYAVQVAHAVCRPSGNRSRPSCHANSPLPFNLFSALKSSVRRNRGIMWRIRSAKWIT